MNDQKTRKIDTKEFELPETIFVRDIENKVFQEIVLQCLNKIPGIIANEGNFIENIFSRSGGECLKGICTEQDNRNHSISIKVEVNIAYGVSIPEKAEEIQSIITEEITRITGLHVSSVHVVFKSLIAPNNNKRVSAKANLKSDNCAEEYSDAF